MTWMHACNIHEYIIIRLIIRMQLQYMRAYKVVPACTVAIALRSYIGHKEVHEDIAIINFDT